MTRLEKIKSELERAPGMIEIYENEDSWTFWDRMYSDVSGAIGDMISGVYKLRDIRDELISSDLTNNDIIVSGNNDTEEDLDEFVEEMKSNFKLIHEDLAFLSERGEEGNSEEILEEIYDLLDTVKF